MFADSIESTRCQYCDYLPDGLYLCDPINPRACEPCKRLFEIETKVKEIRRMLVSLESERQKLKRQVNQHHDTLVHRLPSEITGEIFEACIPENLFDFPYASIPPKSMFSTPLLISGVCTSWRDLAYSMPRLWNILPLYAGGAKPRHLPAPFLIGKWIERAGQLPLYIALREPLLSGMQIVGVIRALNEHSHRWGRINIGVESISWPFFSQQTLPELRSIHLESKDYNVGPLFRLFPERLVSLSVPQMVRLPMEHLTQIRLGNVTIFELFDTLQGAPNLIKFIVRLNDSRVEDIHNPLPSIVHSRLQDFTICLHQNTRSLEKLACTSLKSFTFNDECNPIQMSPFIAFLKNSQNSLINLSLSVEIQLSEFDTASICQGFHLLQHLSLESFSRLSKSIMNTLISFLAEFTSTDGEKVPTYLPNLRSLRLELNSLSNWTKLPNIFGYPAGHKPGNHRPALNFIAILTYEWDDRFTDKWSLPDVMDNETLQRILWLGNSGVKWQCEYDQSDLNFDLIQYTSDLYDSSD